MGPRSELQKKIGQLLSSSFELVERIFVNLTYAEIQRARRVCRTCNAMGVRVLKRRKNFHYMTLPPSLPENGEKVEMNFSETAQEMFENLFSTIRSEPRYCIGFAMGDWVLTDIFATKYIPQGSSISNLLTKILPCNCDIAIARARGVVGTVPANSTSSHHRCNTSLTQSPHSDEAPMQECAMASKEGLLLQNGIKNARLPSDGVQRSNPQEVTTGPSVEIEMPSGYGTFPSEALSLVLIPDLPGVTIKVIKVEGESTCDGRTSCSLTPQEFDRMCGLSPDDDIKGLLYFASDADDITSEFLELAAKRQHEKIAIGGGIVEKVQQREAIMNCNLAILFSGPSVATASVIIPQSVKKVSSIDKYIMKLKECNLPEDHSVAFMFACCGRGCEWYREYGGVRRSKTEADFRCIESRAFRNRFPITPLFGFFGEGEFGINYLDKMAKDGHRIDASPNPHKRAKRVLEHQFTTIIVIVSFL